MLVLLTFFWVLLGGFIWWLMCSSGLKRTALGKQPSFWNCLWASWSCVAASSTHTKESHVYGRMLALSLSLGGLLSYSILCGTVRRARLSMAGLAFVRAFELEVGPERGCCDSTRCISRRALRLPHSALGVAAAHFLASRKS